MIKKNILIATGNVKIIDNADDIKIYSENVTYLKNKEIIISEGNSKAKNENIEINANKFKYNKITNIIDANGSVKIENKIENYIIFSDDITYLRNLEKIITKVIQKL